MKIESNQKESVGVPVAFIDDVGDLWVRTTHESDLMDNQVSIIRSNKMATFDYFDMGDFVDCLDNHEQSPNCNYAVEKFYEGDSFTIKF